MLRLFLSRQMLRGSFERGTDIASPIKPRIRVVPLSVPIW